MPKLRPEYRDLLLVWFELPVSFFVKLQELTKRTDAPAAEVLKRALRQYEESLDSKTQPNAGPADRSPAALSAMRWAKMTPAERSEFARKMSLRRWEKRQK
jgi:hypothetical protein